VPERYLTIKIATEAFRSEPRRSERVLEVYSPSILKLVRCLFVIIGSFAYIIDGFGVIKAVLD
jgi:hypothetical protein